MKTKKILKLLRFICGEKFKNSYKNEKEAEKYKKVRDHCHFTGKYRGCAHSMCNLNFCNRYFKTPVFFHNMKNYDGHLIIQNAEKLRNKKKIDVIAQNSEKFINIGFASLSVKDSFSFITASLDKLVSMTKYDNTDEKDRRKWVLRDNWQSNFRYSSNNDIIKTEKCLDLLLKKGYIHMITWMLLINLLMNSCHLKNNFTVDWLKKIYLMMTTPRQSKYGSILISRTWVNIMICI